jgi:hypothetical protein
VSAPEIRSPPLNLPTRGPVGVAHALGVALSLPDKTV